MALILSDLCVCVQLCVFRGYVCIIYVCGYVCFMCICGYVCVICVGVCVFHVYICACVWVCVCVCASCVCVCVLHVCHASSPYNYSWQV